MFCYSLLSKDTSGYTGAASAWLDNYNALVMTEIDIEGLQDRSLGIVADSDDEHTRVMEYLDANGGIVVTEHSFANFATMGFTWVLNVSFPDKDAAMIAKLSLQ